MLHEMAFTAEVIFCVKEAPDSLQQNLINLCMGFEFA